MSENYQVLKFSKDSNKKTIEIISGDSVSLPKNAPISFRVDQVNTVLYTVKITVEKEKSKAVTEDKDLIKAIAEFIKNLLEKKIPLKLSDNGSAADAEKALKNEVQKVCQLNSKLDELLYASESPEFYNGNTVKNFEAIKNNAAKAAKDLLGLSNDTSQKIDISQVIRDGAEEAIKAVHNAHQKAGTEAPSWVPKDLSDTSKEARNIVGAFVKTIEKLQAIETAMWHKDDIGYRVLEGKIKYTCVITPKPEYSQLKEKKLKKKEIVVTVSSTVGLSGLKTTSGFFITHLTNDSYINKNDKIARGSQEDFSQSFGFLVHVPLGSWHCRSYRGAVAASGGGAGIVSLNEQSVSLDFKKVQPAIGVSLLLVSNTSDSSLVLTLGAIVKPVKRLNGYCVGDSYPEGELTATVNKLGGLFAITFAYDFIEGLGLKSDNSP